METTAERYERLRAVWEAAPAGTMAKAHAWVAMIGAWNRLTTETQRRFMAEADRRRQERRTG